VWCSLPLVAGWGTSAAAGTVGAKLQRVAFRDLPGWRGDAMSEALPALLSSCKILSAKPAAAAVGPGGMAGTAGEWRVPCKALAATSSDDALRQALETRFVPFAVNDADGPEGLFTGYYEPELQGSRKRTGGYTVPLYQAPPDLVEARPITAARRSMAARSPAADWSCCGWTTRSMPSSCRRRAPAACAWPKAAACGSAMPRTTVIRPR
jgi:hypothetical protein